MLKSKKVDALLGNFNKLVNELHDLAAHHTERATDKEIDKIMLEQQIKEHYDEADRAKTIANRIGDLIAP